MLAIQEAIMTLSVNSVVYLLDIHVASTHWFSEGVKYFNNYFEVHVRKSRV